MRYSNNKKTSPSPILLFGQPKLILLSRPISALIYISNVLLTHTKLLMTRDLVSMTYFTVGIVSPHGKPWTVFCNIVLVTLDTSDSYFLSNLSRFQSCKRYFVLSSAWKATRLVRYDPRLCSGRRIIEARNLLQPCLTFQLLLRPWQDTRHAIRRVSYHAKLSPCKERERVRVLYHCKKVLFLCIHILIYS
jgi:hypothetical protein